jgi:glutathione S-transferase
MNVPSQPIRLYRYALSGHAHRVQLFLSLLNLPYQMIDIDLRQGEQKQEAFLAKNPFGQVPVIEDGDTTVFDSNAILVYLATNYGKAWLPSDALSAATVQRWFTMAAGPIAFGAAAARVAAVFGAPIDAERAKSIAHNLFKMLNNEMAGKDFALGAKPSVADIAAYTYIAHAPEGGISLDAYPHIRKWITRIEALPGFVPMKKSAPKEHMAKHG